MSSDCLAEVKMLSATSDKRKSVTLSLPPVFCIHQISFPVRSFAAVHLLFFYHFHTIQLPTKNFAQRNLRKKETRAGYSSK
jgi:hypothetical protein